MNKLPETKKKNGYLYTLVARSDKAAMYSMKNEKEPLDDSIGYEVFLVKVQKAATIPYSSGSKKGQLYHMPEQEKFPGNEDFGKWAWAFMTNEAAMKKFQEVS